MSPTQRAPSSRDTAAGHHNPAPPWRYLLPQAQFDNILCLAEPSAELAEALAQLGREVTLAGARVGASEAAREHGWPNVRVRQIAANASFDIDSGRVTLVLLAAPWAVQRLGQDDSLRRELRRVLHPAGLLYFEFGPRVDQMLSGKTQSLLVRQFGPRLLLRLAPTWSRSVRSLVRMNDRATALHLLSTGLREAVLESRQRHPGDPPARPPVISRACRRGGVLLGPDAAELADGPPRAVRRAAQLAGIDLKGFRWGLIHRGPQRSPGTLMFLYADEQPSPRYVVKLAVDPQRRQELEHQYRILCRLRDLGIVEDGSVPQPAFFQHDDAMAILGTAAMAGTRLAFHRLGTMDHPAIRAVVEWLIRLAARTARPAGDATPAMAARLDQLADRFLATYWLTPQQRDFVSEQVGLLCHSAAELPLVFQHGNPVRANFLVSPAAGVSLLGWKAASPQGMPLWDLLIFLGSCARAIARQARGGRRRRKLSAGLFADEGFRRPVTEMLGQYSQAIGLAPHLVDSLVLTCWMDRAVHQAERLPSERIQAGRYVGLVREWTARKM